MFLIGAQTDANAPRLYIYELPPRFNSWMQAGTSGWWQDMDLWGEDVIIHRRALSSLYRVTDPEQADFFLVPVWVSSAMWQARDCPLEPLSPRTQHEHPSSGELGIQGFARYGRTCGGRVHRLHPYDMALFRPARWCRPPLGFRPRSGWLADPRERWDSHPFVCLPSELVVPTCRVVC